MRTTIQRGFTLIELMTVIAIVGILAAVAIPTFMAMMTKSRTSEADLNLSAIATGAKAFYVEHNQFPSQSDGAGVLVPDEPCCQSGEKDRKCRPDPSVWHGTGEEPTVWDDLDFSMDDRHHFQYSYTSDGATFVAIAAGDLDCDGTGITYSMTGESTGGVPSYRLTKPASPD